MQSPVNNISTFIYKSIYHPYYLDSGMCDYTDTVYEK